VRASVTWRCDNAARETSLRHLINNPVRKYDFVEKLELFLVLSVATILVIRTQLWLTNYPQLGGNGLHIAHLLYGGIFMAIAIWISLTYMNRRTRNVTAILGGIGFGFFIDELGKFITADNNYFFKPAAGIIYLVFIVMFLAIREMSRRQKLDPRTALANALAFLPSTVIGDFRRSDLEVAGELLDRADPGDPLVAQTRSALEKASVEPSRPPSRVEAWLARQNRRITVLTEKPWFGRAVITVIVIWAALSLLTAAAIEINFGNVDDGAVAGEDSSLSTILRTLSILVSVGFVSVGVVRMLRGEHQRAYRGFTQALLVSIFVTRFFSFLDVQFAAVFGLGLDLLLYAAVRELAGNDSQRRVRFPAEHGAGHGGGGGGTSPPQHADGENAGHGEEEAQAQTL
jgi:hypothetical protein